MVVTITDCNVGSKANRHDACEATESAATVDLIADDSQSENPGADLESGRAVAAGEGAIGVGAIPFLREAVRSGTARPHHNFGVNCSPGLKRLLRNVAEFLRQHHGVGLVAIIGSISHSWRKAARAVPSMSAWPLVIVILAQMAAGGFSVYMLSAVRAYITNESLWSKGEHQSVYTLSLYLGTQDPQYLQDFDRAIAVPLLYRKGREFLNGSHPDIAAAHDALLSAGAATEDIPSLIWTFRYCRGLPYLKESIALWKATDRSILELHRLRASIGAAKIADMALARNQLRKVEAEIEPKVDSFTRALDKGARAVERLLMLANLAFAGLLAGLTVWRVGKILKQRRLIEDELAWQASHDALTGLVNRRAFEERLIWANKPAKDGAPVDCALLIIDLDQFKIVNDTCGHAAGDALLRRICPALQQLLGPDDLFARLGGDEFSILLSGTDLARALAAAENVRATVEQLDFFWDGRCFSVTASIGLVHIGTAPVSPCEMMRAADMACFMAKEKGRNNVQVHCEEDRGLPGEIYDMSWVQRIHEALVEDAFCLHAQEIVALSSNDHEGIRLEVLVQMRDETGALVPPSSFLPAAERFGLTTLIDRWVVRNTFRILAERRSIKDMTPITSCGIKVSGSSVGDEAFFHFLHEAFAEFRLRPQTICFEVTETSAIDNLDAARVFVGELRGLGCSFALGDFGSSMSSFNYLKELPVDYLKIDGGFVKQVLTNRPSRAMVEMINHVGHVMGKQIVAKFVETEALKDALRDIGVDYGQGHALAPSKPFLARFESAILGHEFLAIA